MSSNVALRRERLTRLRNKQDNALISIFLHRPLAIGLLWLIADVAWVTPNLLTTTSILLRAASAAALWPEAWGGLAEGGAKVAIVLLLLHLGCTLDCADGALARYRGTSSVFGRYYDKVSDRVLTLLVVSAIAAQAVVRTGDVVHLFLCLAFVALWSAVSVAKWIALGIEAELGRGGAAADPLDRPPPDRTVGEWIRYLAYSLRYLFVVSEVDLSFWLTLGLLTGRIEWLPWVLGTAGSFYALLMLVRRGVKVLALERAK